MGNPNEIKGHREAPNIKGCLLLIIGIKCEIKGVARQPLWEECNCNLEASEFFAETHLDKSRLKRVNYINSVHKLSPVILCYTVFKDKSL